VILGLAGCLPAQIGPDAAAKLIDTVDKSGVLPLAVLR
jgi:hypothetical protein